MSTDREAEAKITQEERIEKLRQVAKRVKEICSFGSTNTLPYSVAGKNFYRFIKQLNIMLEIPQRHPQKSVGIRASLIMLTNPSTFRDFPANMKEAPMGLNSAPNNEANQKLPHLHYLAEHGAVFLELIKAGFKPEVYQWGELAPDHLLATLSFYYKQTQPQRYSLPPSAEADRLIGIVGNDTVRQVGVAADEVARANFIAKIAMEALLSPALYGFANCMPLTDIAMLETILSGRLHEKISYINFSHSKDKVEDLNALVFGEWPQPGCLILSCWLGGPIKEEIFEWNGELANTLPLKHYDQKRCIFDLDDEAERQLFADFLTGPGINWQNCLALPERKKTMDFVRRCGEQFYEHLEAAGFVTRPVPKAAPAIAAPLLAASQELPLPRPEIAIPAGAAAAAPQIPTAVVSPSPAPSFSMSPG